MAWPDAPTVLRTSPEIDAFPENAVVRRIELDRRIVTAIAPSPEDLIVSKLVRLDEKDRLFIEAYHSVRPLNPNVIEQLIRLTDLETPVADRARVYIRNLARKNP